MVLKSGLSHAVTSIASMTGLTPMYSLVMSQVVEKKLPSLMFHTGKEHTVISTPLIGDIEGMSYLILNPYDQDYVSQHRTVQTERLRESFTREICNIISANVVSHLSANLSCQLYGGVPQIEILQAGEKISAFLDKSVATFDRCYVSIAEIGFEEDPFAHPLFIWVLDEKYLAKAALGGFGVTTFDRLVV